MPVISKKINNTTVLIVLAFMLLIALVIVYYNIKVKEIDRNINITRSSASISTK